MPANVTAVAPVKPVPVIVTAVPPVAGPALGVTAVMTGAVMYVYAPAAVAVPPVVAMATSTVPTPAGDTAVICVAETTMTLVAGAPSKVTAVASVRLVPVIVTGVP